MELDAKFVESVLTTWHDHQALVEARLDEMVRLLERIDMNTVTAETTKPIHYTAEFNAFWMAYPKHRRNDKPGCFATWRKLGLKADIAPKVMMALEYDKNSSNWKKDGGKFIPACNKWLRARRWDGDLSDGEERPEVLTRLDAIEDAMWNNLIPPPPRSCAVYG